MVVLSEECDENELFKPQLLDRPNKETTQMYPESVGIVFSRVFIDSSRETTTFGHIGSRKTLRNGRLPTRAAP